MPAFHRVLLKPHVNSEARMTPHFSAEEKKAQKVEDLCFCGELEADGALWPQGWGGALWEAVEEAGSSC